MSEKDGTLDMAEQEFINYCQANDLECDTDSMEEDDAAAFGRIKKRFIKAIKEKRLVVDGTVLEYTVSKFSENHSGDNITIKRPNGKVILAIGQKSGKTSNQGMATSMMIAEMCKVETSYINQLDISDRNFLQDILLLFLGS